MRVASLLSSCLLAALALVACGGGSSDGPSAGEPQRLAAPETFVWGDQPIAFSPPPSGWERQKEQSGGLKGVRFIKSGSVGEVITVAEHYQVGDRDRCVELEDLLIELDDLDDHAFRKALQLARPYVREPIHSREQELVDAANQSLDRAAAAHRTGDLDAVADALEQALDQLSWIRFSLEDVVDRVVFQEPDPPMHGHVFEVGDELDDEVAGHDAVSIDYTLTRYRKDHFVGRETYFLHENRLFVASFLGLPENISLFEAVLDTVSFPPGACAH